MLLDMHMHEKTYSPDSVLSLEEMVTIAREKGLDGICITDHDSMGLKGYAEEFSRKTGFPIFVGIEFFSLQGDIVAFGIDEYPDHRVDAQTFINYVRARDGITISAHPFRNNQRGLKEHLLEVTGLDAVEVLNGSTLPDATSLAAQYTAKLGLGAVGASDCHVPRTVGICATWFPGEVRSMQELIRAVRAKESAPAYYSGSYHIYEI